MAFLIFNGLEVAPLVEGASVQRTDVGQWGRGSAFTYEGATYRALRQWTFELAPLTEAEAHSLTGWLEGRGSLWTFTQFDSYYSTTRFTRFSCESGFSMGTGATQYATSKFGAWAAQLNTSALSTFTAQLENASTPVWSFSVWKANNGSSYALCSAVHDGSTVRYYGGTTGTGLTTAFAWVALSSYSGGFLNVQLQGENTAGTAGTTQYDQMMVLPYALTTPMLTARNNRAQAEPNFPYVELTGTAISTGSRTLQTKVFVEKANVVQTLKDGIVQPRYQLSLRVEER